ncbi:MAG: peptide-methionine (S)-S-oxide reductase MsrA [Flavobacteriaceae bacterium]|nr:peptide-methionine (S)-S-oxide reductase MsrA [Flavobacteriaceae bacterium]
MRKFILILLLSANIMAQKSKEIVIGNGCFWCTEAIFQQLEGVEVVEPGYTGGDIKNPTYKEICTGTTNHAEVLKIKYNPEAISYELLLDVFFYTHDPTTLNRQGNDIGTQYRSVIFYKTQEEKQIAVAKILELDKSGDFDNKIVTQVVELTDYYSAEDYHKDYYSQNKEAPYCKMVITPKISKFIKKYSKSLKK